MNYVIHNTHAGFISKHWNRSNAKDLPYTVNAKGAYRFTSEGEARNVAIRLINDNVAQLLDILILLD